MVQFLLVFSSQLALSLFEVDPRSASDFSAQAYFFPFVKELYVKIQTRK